ncbi:hypothetical protein [Eubacterium limosum]|uniref:hypothetical protein n=1 Tax=Eubacterium limosum TaxID=1736 RepID=UPI001063BB5C|nr:hypothetical protein [Eubacterium limosum]
MRHKYNNVMVELLKMYDKYIPKGFYADGKHYEIKEIVKVDKGFIRCGAPGLRYIINADGKRTELLFDNRTKKRTAVIYDPERTGANQIPEDLRYLN